MDAEAPPHPDLSAEQAYLDVAYDCLEEMRRAAARAMDSDAVADPGALEALHHLFLTRLADLNEETALCFGRIDRTDGDTFYIGRRHVHDANLDPMVVDWRAPVSEAFYQANAEDPWELLRRRSFLGEGRRLHDIQDEVFAELRTARSAEAAGPLVRSGDALLAELTRERTGRMRDVAATIQAEQDRLIRSPAEGVLVVQGAPGTGKTAVGLHRAAYLLYQRRASLSRTGVLIVGPNRAFMRYVERVLPDLGETTVVQKAIDEVPAVRATAEDPEDVVRLKGDARMAEVLRRALIQRTRPPAGGTSLHLGVRSVAIDPDEVARLLANVHRLGAPYRERRDRFAVVLAEAVAAGGARRDGDTSELLGSLPRDRGFRALLDRIWPTVTAADVVGDLVGGGPRARAAADGLLEPDEQRRLSRDRRSMDSWSAPDGVLIDEAQALITGTPRTYGHALVDEAQDLSPMQLRMIARRAPSGSITILGDVAQATGAWPHTTWDDLLAHLPGGGQARVESLTIGYRVPAEMLELANRLLPRIAPGLRPAEPIRSGQPPAFVRVAEGSLPRAVVREIEEAIARQGSVGVIVPDGLRDEIEVLARVHRIEVDAADWGRGRKITLLTPRQAKGLEFDHVVLAEPAQIVDGTGDGYRQLYVALTRATRTLRVIHARDLPGELRPPG